MKRILVAGIGNIFMGDDAFGCEVIRELSARRLPEGVQAIDFGIRSYDLACVLTEDYDAVILIDALPQNEAPGTLCIMEIDLNELPSPAGSTTDAHSLNPASALQMAQSLGEVDTKIYLIGCEPEVLEDESGEMELSDAVRKTIPLAVAMVESLIAKVLNLETKKTNGLVPV